MAYVFEESAFDPVDRTDDVNNPLVSILSDPGSGDLSFDVTLAGVGAVDADAAFSFDLTLLGVGSVDADGAFFPDVTLAGTGLQVIPGTVPPRVLGCPSEYQIVAIEEIANMNTLTGQAVFGRPVGAFDGITEMKYDRRLDDTSVATLTISTDADCCTSGFLGDLHPWHHGIAIYRDGELVWDGPIVLIEATRTTVTITANDISALLSKRLLPRDLCFSLDPLVCTGGVGGLVFGPQAPETVARVLIEQALAVDGHGAFVQVSAVSATTYEASYKRYGGPVFDLIQKLATEYVNWTVLGRLILVSVGGGDLGSGISRTEILTCDDFIGDNFKVTEDGLAALTQDVQIADPIVVAGVEQVNIGVGQIFTIPNVVNAYYGLLQGVQEANEALAVGANPTAALSAAALNVVNGSYPPPVSLSAEGMQLSPNAPVTMAQLVPGVLVPVHADCLCKEVSAVFILSKVEVTVGATGEVVVPSFISLGSDNAAESGA